MFLPDQRQCHFLHATGHLVRRYATACSLQKLGFNIFAALVLGCGQFLDAPAGQRPGALAGPANAYPFEFERFLGVFVAHATRQRFGQLNQSIPSGALFFTTSDGSSFLGGYFLVDHWFRWWTCSPVAIKQCADLLCVV